MFNEQIIISLNGLRLNKQHKRILKDHCDCPNNFLTEVHITESDARGEQTKERSNGPSCLILLCLEKFHFRSNAFDSQSNIPSYKIRKRKGRFGEL